MKWLVGLVILGLLAPATVIAQHGRSQAFGDNIYEPGTLKPVDSILKVREGDQAPDFTLPAVSGKKVRLSDFREKRNVILSFVPAAWTPVCSDQWPGYNLARPLFESHNTVLLGITVDNIPTLYAWTHQMGELWFEVLSDFWPHGAVADQYGVLRGDGTADRALFLIDKAGKVRYAEVTDINRRPPLEKLVQEMEKVSGGN